MVYFKEYKVAWEGRVMRKKILLVGGLVALLGFSACDESTEDDGKIEAPFSSDEAVGDMLYTDAETKLSESGFTNVKTVPIEDLITGWLTDDGEIESISIDGDTEFSIGDRFNPGVEVEIQYHTFPSDTKSDEETSEGHENNVSQSDSETTEEPPNITVDNNSEFSAVLNNNTDDDSPYITFANKYNNQIIELDGHIEYLGLYDDYDTRWEALIVSGDWAGWEASYAGPVFKTQDFNMQEVKFEGLMETEINVHVVGRIMEYNETQQLFFIDPITITQR